MKKVVLENLLMKWIMIEDVLQGRPEAVQGRLLGAATSPSIIIALVIKLLLLQHRRLLLQHRHLLLLLLAVQGRLPGAATSPWSIMLCHIIY